ncbi:MAG: 50S ribosomal protein L20 [Simkaniaceae bacterium]|nr:50S ribosomal protein L20 [Simkaniaceae bacterium]MCF7851781.1 50S ribosomal protein L20 [Simkaniaceae bacterium]
MVRVTSSTARHRRRKRLLKKAKGFFGDRKNHLRLTKDAVMNAMAFNYIHRKQKKREFRSLWITRISVAAKIHGISYSKFMDGLKKAGCLIDRKMLSELAIHDPKGFAAVVNEAKAALV